MLEGILELKVSQIGRVYSSIVNSGRSELYGIIFLVDSS